MLAEAETKWTQIQERDCQQQDKNVATTLKKHKFLIDVDEKKKKSTKWAFEKVNMP